MCTPLEKKESPRRVRDLMGDSLVPAKYVMVKSIYESAKFGKRYFATV